MIKIRDVTATDIDSIKKIEVAGGLASWKTSDYLDQLLRNDTIFLAAVNTTDIVGFALVRLITPGDDLPGIAEILNIAVDPQRRRNKIGNHLMDRCFAVCRGKAIDEIWLEVRESNIAAVNFYKNHGFIIVGKRKSYYSDPIEAALVMKRHM